MSKVGEVKLGLAGSEITLPRVGRQLRETDIEITREDRLASGKLVIDRIARKKLFYLSYTAIKGPDLDAIVAEYDRDENLNFIIKDRDEETRSYTVRFRPFTRRRWRVTDKWWWRDVELELEEI